MKLTGELKDKVETAETPEEKKDIIAQAGMELTDEELEGVAGGSLGLGPGAEGKCLDCGHIYKAFTKEQVVEDLKNHIIEKHKVHLWIWGYDRDKCLSNMREGVHYEMLTK